MYKSKTPKHILFLLFFSLSFSVYAQSPQEGSDNVIIRSISILGNNRTKGKIIRRELVFTENDTLKRNQLSELVKKSKENLQNTSLFNFVEIHTRLEKNLVDIQIVLQERWYIWPSFYFNHTERNFNLWWQEKDLTKLTAGVGLQVKNVRGRNENFKIDTRFGYKTRIEFGYDNISLDAARKHHIGIYYAYQTQDQMPYFTNENKPKYIRTKGETLRYFQEADFNYFYRPKYKIRHHVELKYYDLSIVDTIKILNPDYLLNGSSELRFFNLRYFFEYENRDYSYYPLDGQYLSLEFSKIGLGFIPSNLYKTFIFKANFIEHKKISNHISLGSGWFTKLSTFQNVPYAFIDGLGYQKNLRGFDFYTIEGNSYLLSQQQIKFTIIQPHTYEIPYLKNQKFSKLFFAYYINLFYDAAYINGYQQNESEINNFLQNKYLYSFGIGMDFVTYYDKVLRIDFTHNSLNENGIFLSFKASLHN